MQAKRTRRPLRPETIRKAQEALPATREELAQALGVVRSQSNAIAKYLLENGYAHEWESRLTSKGRLEPILHATEKVPYA